MAFDKTKPANTQKIRLGPGDITANFAAIEEGDTTFNPAKVNLAVQGGDPGALAANGIIYTKIDSGANPELHHQNAAGDVVQLTEDANLGSQTTDIYAQTVSFDGGTFTNNQNAMVSAWADAKSGGGTNAAYELTVVRNSKGDYTATFTTPMASANYVVVGTVAVNVTRARVLYVYSQTANDFSVRVQAINASAGSYEDLDFMVSVFGGR